MQHFKNIKLVFFLVSLCLLTCLYACKDKEDPLPYAYINQTFSTLDPAYFALQSVGGSCLIKYEGINGIIVYRKTYEEIVAYEANCTYKPEDRCAVNLSENDTEAQDSCCGSVFQLYNGAVINGPATRALYAYKVTFDGESFTITNN